MPQLVCVGLEFRSLEKCVVSQKLPNDTTGKGLKTRRSPQIEIRPLPRVELIFAREILRRSLPNSACWLQFLQFFVLDSQPVAAKPVTSGN